MGKTLGLSNTYKRWILTFFEMRYKLSYIILIVALLLLVLFVSFQNIDKSLDGELGSFGLFPTSEIVSFPFNLYVNDSFNKIYNRVDKEEFSELLADVDLSEGKITQSIVLGSDPNLVFKRQPTVDRDPSLGLRISDNVSKEFYKLELDFDENDEIKLEDLIGKDINLFGRRYQVSTLTQDRLRLADEKIIISKISNNNLIQAQPHIYGDIVVWNDERNGNLDVYMYDISTEIETQITDSELNQFGPLIYKNKILWNDERNGNLDVYMYDIDLDEEFVIANGQLNENIGALYNDIAAINVYKNEFEDPDVFIFNLTSGEKTQVTIDQNDQYATGIYENKLIYLNRSGFDLETQNVVVYDLDLQENILTTILSRSPPSIFNNKIISYRYGDINENTVDLYIYDLETSSEVKITNTQSNRHPGSINENFATWYQFRDDQSTNIYYYDINNDREFLLTNDSSFEDGAKLYERNIVWSSNKSGNREIYLANIDFDDKLVLVGGDGDLIIQNEANINIGQEEIGNAFSRIVKNNGYLDKIEISVAAKNRDNDALLLNGKFVDPVFRSFDIRFDDLNLDLLSSSVDTQEFVIESEDNDKMSISYYEGNDRKKIVFVKSSSTEPSLAHNDDFNNISILEGELIRYRDRIVIGDSERGKIVELIDIRNSTVGTNRDKLVFRDIFTRDTYETFWSSDGKGTVSISGIAYRVNMIGNSASLKESYSVYLDSLESEEDNELIIYPVINTSEGNKFMFYEPVSVDLTKHNKLMIPNGNNFTFIYFNNLGEGIWEVSDESITQQLNSNQLGSRKNINVGKLNFSVSGKSRDNINLYLKNSEGFDMGDLGLVIFEKTDDLGDNNAFIIEVEPGNSEQDGVGVDEVSSTWFLRSFDWRHSLPSDNDIIQQMDRWGSLVELDSSDRDQKKASIKIPNQQVFGTFSINHIGVDEEDNLDAGSEGTTTSSSVGSSGGGGDSSSGITPDIQSEGSQDVQDSERNTGNVESVIGEENENGSNYPIIIFLVLITLVIAGIILYIYFVKLR